MRRFLPLMLLALITTGCGTTATPIAKLTLPPVTAIEGIVVSIEESSFIVDDGTGTIEVETDSDTPLPLVKGETVRVLGNLDEDDSKEFDAYRLIRADGSEIRFVEM